MTAANQFELQMLALINAERAAAGLQALRINSRLNTSAETHSRWMLEADVFSHTGSGSSSATDRMRAAGYVFSGSWSSGENIAWQSERGAAGISDDVVNLHQSLMNSPGHRANILNPNFTEIGIGIESGQFNLNGTNWPAVMVTQNFARSSADNGGSGEVTPPPPPPPPAITEGNDLVNGTTSADLIDARGGDDRVNGNAGADTLNGGLGNDSLYGGTGNDTMDGGSGNDVMLGEDGDDRMLGVGGNDNMNGGVGNDRLGGGSGNDTLAGDVGRDHLSGSSGNDQLFGGAGNDKLEGGAGSDVLTGGADQDTFLFRPGFGSDRVVDFTDNVDTLSFGGGLWNGSMSAQTFIATFARVSGSSVIFDFGGGDTVTVNGVNALSRLTDDVSFFS